MPAWYDETNYPVVYATKLEAQREIADDLISRLQQFLDGDSEFDDATSIDDFILLVDVWTDGSISIENGRVFGKRA